MIALITPTGGRPEQIQLCAGFMVRQDYKGEVLWVIIDDGIQKTTDCITNDFREGWKIIKIFPEEKWKPGGNTQARNLLLGIEEVENYEVELIFIVEDDDYYSPQYLRKMIEGAGGYDLIGEQNTVYYNPVMRRYRYNRNDRHASLFQVAFRPTVISLFKTVCKVKQRFVDIILFKMASMYMIKLYDSNQHFAIGIKGLGGRPGIGQGHRLGMRMEADLSMTELKKLIGEDYVFYKDMYEPTSIHNRGRKIR